MPPDFLDASKRHRDDAEQLYSMQRWANAGHLYGLAAECGLKRLMLAFGMQTNANGAPVLHDDKVHANKIWLRYETYRGNSLLGPQYGLPNGRPFDNWDIADRYAHQSNFNNQIIEPYRNGANAVLVLIKQAELAGLI